MSRSGAGAAGLTTLEEVGPVGTGVLPLLGCLVRGGGIGTAGQTRKSEISLATLVDWFSQKDFRKKI